MMADLGLLILRVGFGGLLFLGHGWEKLLGFSHKAAMFPDPLHVGGRASLALAIFAEVVCSLLVALGVMTRLSAVPPFITMLVAASLVHAHDPWSKKEAALLYAIPFLVIILTGPGAFSIDWMVRKKK